MTDRKQERREFLDSLGRTRVMDRLGVRSPAAITNAIRLGLPAKWLPVIEDLCREDGRDCPRTLFNVYRSREPERAA